MIDHNEQQRRKMFAGLFGKMFKPTNEKAARISELEELLRRAQQQAEEHDAQLTDENRRINGLEDNGRQEKTRGDNLQQPNDQLEKELSKAQAVQTSSDELKIITGCRAEDAQLEAQESNLALASARYALVNEPSDANGVVVAWISTLRVAENLDEAIQRSKGLISTLSNDLRVVKADSKTWKTKYATLIRNTAVLTHEHADVCGNAYDDVREMVEFRGNGKEKA
ncbi:hypothetical protein LTS18_009533, partial [Coniosporium uncinatum]